MREKIKLVKPNNTMELSDLAEIACTHADMITQNTPVLIKQLIIANMIKRLIENQITTRVAEDIYNKQNKAQ